MDEILLTTVLPLAIAFIMFSLGLGLTFADFARALARPGAAALGRAARLDRPGTVALAMELGIRNGARGIAVGGLAAGGAAAPPPCSLPSGAYGITMHLRAFAFVAWARRWVRDPVGAPA